MKFIALYKTFRGGEWFAASLQSIANHVDGIVAVQSTRSWIGGELKENCREVLQHFKTSVPVITINCETDSQEVQYQTGIDAIIQHFGEDAVALIIDTDEIWDAEMLDALKLEIMANPNIDRFYSTLHTYVRSPLYQVFPQHGSACVAINHLTKMKPFRVRFLGEARNKFLKNIFFHHYSYVREDPNDIFQKFSATSSQEEVKSHPDWLERVWPHLPWGTNLHMTPGYEDYWKHLKILTPREMPDVVQALSFCYDIVATEDHAWMDRMRKTPPQATICATPDWDRHLYADDLIKLFGCVPSSIKTTCQEFLTLRRFAQTCSWRPILELGCGHGGSTLALASGLKDSIVDAVDPFEPYDELTFGGLNRNVREGNEEIFFKTLTQFGVRDRVRHLKYSTETVEPDLRDLYELIFVDANHSYKNAKHDIALAWRHLSPTGLLVCHDYTTRFPGVIQAVDEFDANFTLIAGTTLAIATK